MSKGAIERGFLRSLFQLGAQAFKDIMGKATEIGRFFLAWLAAGQQTHLTRITCFNINGLQAIKHV
jgi:hypothetical protein